ncbi:NADP-dependent oxidoreductase [Homoserinibacter sp. YIM 151385]|uniref:NADP-dependent oxidoreductase n=1 Tax=Homoserinibacter sp. YIM 151385 TaxID=2985506 RepID=UPI0022F06B36|nr:NADP-dependent oxidoreductase [Homoserinibacter sp. YIM 151385]WBU38801.1 NADP-dependent oxidoreductase [Homoserinibacter sp. YIM 151385]
MKRIQYSEYGGPDVMTLEQFEPAPLRAAEVLVRVRAAAANPMDFGIRSGAMKMVTGRRFPRAMGYDFAGVVEAIGGGVTRFRVGDEVFGGTPIASAGAFADVVVAQERGIVHKPAELSFEDASALPTPAITALQALCKAGRMRAGDRVFVHGCLGAVGRAAVQLAAARGATVAGSCRAGSGDEARELGVDPIVAFDVDPAPLRRRFDIVFDTAGTLPHHAARAMLRRGGRIVSTQPTPANLIKSLLPGPYRAVIAQPVTADLEQIAQDARSGMLRLPVARTVVLSEAIPALIDLEQGRLGKRGKLVILPD